MDVSTCPARPQENRLTRLNGASIIAAVDRVRKRATGHKACKGNGQAEDVEERKHGCCSGVDVLEFFSSRNIREKAIGEVF